MDFLKAILFSSVAGYVVNKQLRILIYLAYSTVKRMVKVMDIVLRVPTIDPATPSIKSRLYICFNLYQQKSVKEYDYLLQCQLKDLLRSVGGYSYN